MAEYTITLTLNEEQRTMLDEARGELEPTEYALHAILRTVEEDLTDYAPTAADELTPADHIRLAEQAKADGLEIDEFEQLVWEGINRQRAERKAGKAQ